MVVVVGGGGCGCHGRGSGYRGINHKIFAEVLSYDI
jgi:hypothetical protein